MEGIRNAGENGVFITFEEAPGDIRRNMFGFGWDIQQLEDEGKWAFVDASPEPGQDQVLIGAYDLGALLARIEHAVHKVNAKRVSMDSLGAIFTQLTDQYTTVEEKDNEFIWTIHKCPVCWGRTGADKPVCFISTGLLQESLKWVSGGNEFRVNESKCVAMGEEICEFVIQKDPIG